MSRLPLDWNRLPAARSDQMLVQGDLGQSLEGLNADLEDSTRLKEAYKSELSL